MTTKHNGEKDREEFLIKLLTGQIEAESEEGRALLESNPELKAELQAIKTISRHLDDMAAHETAAIKSLPKDLPRSPAVEKVLGMIWKEDTGRGHRDGGTRRLFLLIPVGLAAAAALILLITWWMGLNDSTNRPIQYLGGGIDVTSPVGEVDRYRFSWQEYTLPPGGYFALFIDTGQGSKEVWRGTGTSWEPTQSERDGMPDRLDWWVEVYGPSDLDPIARSDTLTMIRR
jgi:hypothetical protein